MYSEFRHIDDLHRRVEEDKRANGYGAVTLDRYPIRFVLFDNFRDCYDFVDYLQNDRGVHVESVDRWIDADYPDLMISHVELAERIEEHIKKKSPNDCVIAPFSELARFYDNEEKKRFDALLKTIKAIQSTEEASEHHQRVYIPIVGLEGKMEAFGNDSQTSIWRFVSEDKSLTYHLVLTANTDFGVQGLTANYTVVNDIKEWLNIWKDTKQQVSTQIICMSQAIYANASHAQPDNAFGYTVCTNAYQFLSEGLGLSFGNIQQQACDGNNWEILAENIDVSEGFDFKKYVHSRFGIDNIDDYKDFIQLWFSHPAPFDRWLLARFYVSIKEGKGYVCQVLSETSNFGSNELIENMATHITELEENIRVRRYCLQYARQRNVQLSQMAESMVARILQSLPEKMGYASALRFFTGISEKEKEIAISWLGQNRIRKEDLKSFYPDLYNYLVEGIGVTVDVPEWVEPYFTTYKQAKVCNKYTQEISDFINHYNASEVTFDEWYNLFCSTYTLLQNRSDIEVFYWIDGLGVDWIPLVKQIIGEKKAQQIYLNEIKIARALLPTKTANNKADLQRLLPAGVPLEKSGDLDSLAHRTDNISPFNISKETELVRKSIEDILQKYSGKKIAIISDHGLTYLSQLVQGKNMAGMESDHHGRIALRKSSSSVSDSSYFRLEDGKTLCALKHESLCSKVPTGQGIHGGCTPEEVLVPIFIISNSPSTVNWSAQLLTLEVSGLNPRLTFNIKNIPSTEVPYVEYNGTRYELHHINGDKYETDDMVLDEKAQSVSLVVGDVEKQYKLMVSTGVQEDELFDL